MTSNHFKERIKIMKKFQKKRVILSAILAFCMVFLLVGCGAKELTYDDALSKLVTYIEENGTQQDDGSFVITVDQTNVTPNYHTHFLAKDGTVSVIREGGSSIQTVSALTFAPGQSDEHSFAIVMTIDDFFVEGEGFVDFEESASGFVLGSEYTGDSGITITETDPGLSAEYHVISPETLVAQDGYKYLNESLDALAALLEEGELGFGIDKLGFTAYTIEE